MGGAVQVGANAFMCPQPQYEAERPQGAVPAWVRQDRPRDGRGMDVAAGCLVVRLGRPRPPVTNVMFHVKHALRAACWEIIASHQAAARCVSSNPRLTAAAAGFSDTRNPPYCAYVPIETPGPTRGRLHDCPRRREGARPIGPQHRAGSAGRRCHRTHQGLTCGRGPADRPGCLHREGAPCMTLCG